MDRDLLRRHGRLLRLPSLAALAFAVALFSACAHNPRGTIELPLRVMSYNIAAGNGNLDAIVAAIRADAPEVVALQEVDVNWSARSNFVDQASVLAEQLGMHVRFAPIYRFPGADSSTPPRQYGLALLSAHPITAFSNHSLTRISTQVQPNVTMLLPGFLDATINVRGTTVRILNTHLDYRADPAMRALEVAETLDIVGDMRVPTLLLGDLNAPPDAPELAKLLTVFRDAWRSATDPGFTYPASAPVKRIDYVLVSPHVRVVGTFVSASTASDHRAMVADLLIASPR